VVDEADATELCTAFQGLGGKSFAIDRRQCDTPTGVLDRDADFPILFIDVAIRQQIA
jgi:hypothetical protein